MQFLKVKLSSKIRIWHIIQEIQMFLKIDINIFLSQTNVLNVNLIVKELKKGKNIYHEKVV